MDVHLDILLINLLMHFWLVRGDETDILGLQLQVNLTNASSPLSAIKTAWKLWSSWSANRPRHFVRRILCYGVPAFVIWAGFTTASIFAGSIASKAYGSTVGRAVPTVCGGWHFNASTFPVAAAAAAKVINDTIQARSYANSFYISPGSASGLSRSIFSQTTLPYEINNSAPCPIPDAGRCLLGPNGATQFSSGRINSHTDLGINAKAGNRVEVQINVTCSPVEILDLTESGASPAESLLLVYAGPLASATNYTYAYDESILGSEVTYLLDTFFAYAQDSSPPWTPISAFNRTDADVTLFILSQNNVGYFGPVTDPFFLANGSSTLSTTDGNFYAPNNRLNALVCVDQFSTCNPVSGACTTPAGQLGMYAQNAANSLGLNGPQLASATRVAVALLNSNTYSPVYGLGPAALFATNQVFNLLSPSLPSSQWQLEAQGWFTTSLAKLQSYIVQYVTNDLDVLAPYGYVNPPPTAIQAAQCTSQLVQTAGEVQNFGFLGVMLIVCISLFLILLDWTSGWIADLLNRRLGVGDLAATARHADDKLQLLRMAIGPLQGPNREAWKQWYWGTPVAPASVSIRRPQKVNALAWYQTLKVPEHATDVPEGEAEKMSGGKVHQVVLADSLSESP